MPLRQGSVLSVQIIPLASGLAVDAAAGATELVLESVDAFQAFGGTAVITLHGEDGQDVTEVIEYGSIDYETETLQLTAPLVYGYVVGADVVANGETTIVTVDLQDGEEPVDAELTHALKTTTALVEGQRGPLDAERVMIDEIAGRWMLVEIIGKKNLIDGGAVDPDTVIPSEAIPPSTDGLPPTAAPTIEAIEAFGVVFIKITPPADQPDPLIGFGVYVNDVLARTTFDTLPAIATNAAGVQLPYDVDSVFRVSASDLDGEGPLSAPVSARPLKLSSSDLGQEIIDTMDASGEAATEAQEDAAAAVAAALAAAAKADAAEDLAAAAETPQGAQDKANIAASTAYTLAVDAAATDATGKANAAQTAASGYTDTQVAGKGKVIAQASKPTGSNQNVNNLWINITDGKNTPHRWSVADNDWVPITDKVAVDAAALAYTAQQAAVAATSAAAAAQTSADGKARIIYVAAAPIDTAEDKEGDTWFRFDGGLLIGQWRHNGTTWVPVQIEDAMIGNLDAAKITSAFANVEILLTAGVIKAEMIEITGPDGLKAKLAAVNMLVANEVFATDGIHISNGLASIDLTVALGYRQSVGGNPRFWLPMDPNAKAYFGGVAVLEQVTIQGDMAIRGTNNEISRGSVVTLSKGTTPPASAPLYTIDTYRRLPLTMGPPSDSGLGQGNNGLEYIGDTFMGLRKFGFMELPNWRVWKTTNPGDVRSELTLTRPTEYDYPTGFTQIGGTIYVAYRADSGSGVARVRTFNATTGAKGTDWTPAGHTGDIVLGSQQSNGELWLVSRNTNGTLRFSQHSGSGTQLATFTTTATIDSAIRHLTVGSFDYGSKRFLVSLSDGTVRSFSATGAAQASETFSVTNTVGIAWVNGKFVGGAAASWFDGSGYFEVSSDPSSYTWVIASSWYDSNASGGLYETKIGPTSTFVQPARTGGFTITLPTAASVVAGDPNSPDSARLYVGSTVGTLKAQGAPFAGGTGSRSFTAASVATTGDSPMTDPATGGRALFPDGTSAIFRSANGVFTVNGLGQITVPDPTMPTDAVNLRTMNDAAAATLVAAKAYSDSKPAISLTRNAVQNVTTLSTFVRVGGWVANNSNGAASASATTITVAEAGWYLVAGWIRMDTATNGRHIAVLYLNGVEAVRMADITGAYTKAFSGSRLEYLAAGSTVEMYVWNSVASNWTAGALGAVRMI